MNSSMQKYKKRMLILCIMLAVVLMITGVSYAVFTNYSSQTDANTLAASCMDLEFNGQNEINLLNTYPISEGEALEQTPYTFTIKNKCDNYIEYYVIASVISITNKIDSKYVKVSLLGDNDLNGTVINSLESISTPQSLSKYNITENYILKRGDGISKDESRTFNFRMWLDSNNKDIWTSEDVEGKDYQVKISVVGTVKTRPKDDLYVAALIDGVESSTFPTTDKYTASVECTRNGKKIDANESIKWNGAKWILATAISDGNVRCNATFNKKLTFADTILAKNGVKVPITTPGTEVNAHILDDGETVTRRVDSTCQKYYVTYGTGWEANGTKFNLTGAAVTKDTYANSYSSLVGKYLVSSSEYNYGSSIAGKMMATTYLKSVYYVVSTTQDSFTYKTLSSTKNITEALLASTEDDYGTSYYFRGAVKNNYVEFANKCWRIVRVGGDGSVKLILHNDNTTGAANPCDAANNSTNAAFARYSGTTYTSAFNTNRDDNAYVGFMYGTAGASDYASAHANTNNSTILTNLETWYNNNLKTYEKVIDDTVWCNDKTNVTDTTYNPYGINYKNVNGLGYAKNGTYYGATQRLVSRSNSAGGAGPSLKCNGELSKINSKIGLITADELALAGYAYGLQNSATYLQENATGNSWWSLSPNRFSDGFASVWIVGFSDGDFGIGLLGNAYGVRPSISLKSTTNVTGDGTSSSPFIISM